MIWDILDRRVQLTATGAPPPPPLHELCSHTRVSSSQFSIMTMDQKLILYVSGEGGGGGGGGGVGHEVTALGSQSKSSAFWSYLNPTFQDF